MQSDDRKVLTESLDAAFKFLRWGAVLVLLAIMCSGITFVRSDEAAVVLRFGKLAGATPADQVHGPGILIAWPYLIDRIVRVPVKRVQEVEITDFSGRPLASLDPGEPAVDTGRAQSSLDPRKVGYCVTGDQNIIHADVLIKYQVSDPIMYALRVEDPEGMIHDAVCEALTQAIGAMTVDAVLAEGKKALGAAAMKRAQERLDDAEAGVALAALEFREIVPPTAVAPDFEAVVSAYVEKETKVQNAQTYREQEVPKAQADRDRMISDAEAFAADRLARARGEISTFKDVLAEYRASPEVVRERLYREAMEKVIGNVGSRVLVPQKGKGARVLLPAEGAKKKQRSGGDAR